MNTEKRTVGGYEIKQSFRIGDKEVLLGEKLNEPNGDLYMCCFAETNALYERYSDAVACDDYLKIAELYTMRLSEQIKQLEAKAKSITVDTSLITPDMCESIDDRDLENEVIVLKPTALRAEYRLAPYQILYCNGGNGARHIILCGGNYTKSWKFTDVNYSVASNDDQISMFLAYSEILNSLAIDATTKITINNRQLNKKEFKLKVWLKHKLDKLDIYRDEINEILLDKMQDSNNIVQEKYVTVSVAKKNIEEARNFFTRIGNDLTAGFNKLASRITPLTIEERLQIFHDFYRGSEEQTLPLNIKKSMRLGHDIIDYVCPDSMEFKSDYFTFGDKYGRVLFLKDFASFIKDSMVSEITDFSRNLMFSVDILPIATDDAVKEVQKKILAVETDITRWQQKQNMNNNFSANIPYDMEQMRKELKEFLDDLTTRDQRMMSALITVVHTADSLEKLNEDTETILSIGRKHLCMFSTLKFQQEDGLNTVLPYGIRRINALRTLTTESTAVFMPFKTQEVMDNNGLFYGVNAISHNLILCNRKLLQNGNGWILGVPGSGKSFFAKFEMILNILYNTEDDIIIVDPEAEYKNIMKAIGGEHIVISAASNNHINALEMVKDYGDGDNPINVKAQFIMSLYEQIVGAGKVKAQERSIIV